MEITKDTTMGEMLDYDGGIAYILMQSGMHCVGCPSSRRSRRRALSTVWTATPYSRRLRSTSRQKRRRNHG